MKILSANVHPYVTHIIHLADLHIRNGDRLHSRAVEYDHVFTTLYNDIKKLPCVVAGTALVVICGDVFHNKGKMETEGAKVLFLWLNKMLQIVPILVIAGNHDFRQEDPSYTDTIDYIVTPYNEKSYKFPIHYLKDTDHYVWENVGIGMCSVKDTLREYNTVGCVDKLPLFPTPDSFPKNIQHRVAMFHGTITQSALPSGRSGESITTGYPLEWMSGYSIALLGDNHKQQINVGINDTLKWGYPGSLIQQDDGEPTFGHGYLLWDLSTYTATSHHIHNNYGNITIIKNDNEGLMVRFSSRDTVPIKDAVVRIGFPKYPKVRLVGIQYDGSCLPILFNKNLIQPSIIKVTNNIGVYDQTFAGYDSALNINSGIVTMNEVNTPQQWEKYLQKQMPTLDVSEWIYDVKKILFNVERSLPSTVLDKIKDRNNTLQKLIDEYDNAIQSIESTRYNITIKSMEWAYIMCYGENNYIDLEKLEGCIVLLNGPNASGKSSFLDVLCLGIYGSATTTRSESSDVKSGAHIIHDDKPNSASAYARVIVDIDGVLYEIKRSFGSSSHGHKNTNYVSVCKIINETDMVLVAEGNLTVDEWIHTRFGTLHDLLMTTAICQMDTTSFFAMNSASQKEVFDKSLNLNTISAYQGILEEAVRAYKQIYTLLGTYIAGRKDRNSNQKGKLIDECSFDNDKLNTDLDQRKLELYELERSIHELTTLSNDIRMNIYLPNNTMSSEVNYLPCDEIEKCLNNAIYEYDISKQHYAENITTEHKQELFIEQGQLYRDYNSLMKQVNDHNITDDEQKMSNMVPDITVLLHTLKVHDENKPTEPIMSETHIIEIQNMYNAWCLRNPEMLMLRDQDRLMKQYQDVKNKLTSTETKINILNNDHVSKPDCIDVSQCDYDTYTGTTDLNDNDYILLKYKVFNCKTKIKVHHVDKPLYTGRNIKQIKDVISKYETWISLQQQDWLEDITRTNSLCINLQENVATISKQCDELQTVSKPNVDRVEDDKIVTVTNNQCNDTIQQLNNKIADLHSKIISTVPLKPESGKSKWKAELKKWRSLCKNVVNCTSDQLRSYKNSYDDLVRKKILLLDVESSTREDIIDLENIPFNPHCDACNKNHKPYQEKLAVKRTLLTQTRSSIEDINKSLDTITNVFAGLNISVKERKRNGLGIDIAIQNREYYEANIERMTQEVHDWTAATKDWKKLNTYHRELKSLETKHSIISWKLYDEYLTKSHDLRVKRDTLREDLAKCTMFCKDASIFIPEYNTAKTELEAYVEWDAWMLKNNVLIDELRNSEIELYQYWKAYRDQLALTLSNLHNEVVHIDKFITENERWTIDMNKANAEYNVLKQWKEWKNIRDRLERDILVATWHRSIRDISVAMNINEITLSKIKAIENAKETVERWTQIKYMQSLHALETQIQEKKHIANNLHKQISELTFRIAELSENSNIDNVYNSELLRLKADLDKLTLFRDVFVGVKGTDGMKSAIYRERVIPLIENEVNAFLNDLEEFRLTIEMNGSKLTYKVHDRGNKVLLGHCSGYQKFMIGLAMRTALSRIGAAGQSIKHLIIDEGFGCCDSNNIQRAQHIVRELMMRGQYKSIILMSHLDAIRDVSQSSINIKRDSGKFSYIQFGNPPKKYKKIKHTGNVGDNELNVSTIEPKPRGRPRKIVNKGI